MRVVLRIFMIAMPGHLGAERLRHDTVVLGISLLISLFTGPGYYLRDVVLIASIVLSPLVGGLWFQGPKNTGD